MSYFQATVGYLRGIFWVAEGLLCGISVPCMGHPWEAPGLKHLAALVVSLGCQFSLAWAATFCSSVDLKCRFFYLLDEALLCKICINVDIVLV